MNMSDLLVKFQGEVVAFQAKQEFPKTNNFVIIYFKLK